MDDFFLYYRIYERVAGILVLVFLTLYLLRCLTAGDFISLGQFGAYLKGLFNYVL
jgi:hypothetical protein